jgi:type II secretory pathway pseudopilin PulG
MHKLLNAYTTLEVLVVIGIMVLVSGIVIPVSLRQTKLNELSITAKDLHSNIFLQQQNAFAGKNDSNHGIYLQGDGYWIFEGEDFANSTKKDFIAFNKGITLSSGAEEIIFEKSSQKPNSNKSLVLSFSGHTYLILISDEGAIESFLQN